MNSLKVSKQISFFLNVFDFFLSIQINSIVNETEEKVQDLKILDLAASERVAQAVEG